MQPEDVQKAADSALKWVDEQMTPADLVAVASIGSSLQILTDFTSSKEKVHSVLTAFSAAEGTAFAAVDASTAATDEASNSATDDTTTVDASAQELDTFNNDVRLRALKTLAEALAADSTEEGDHLLQLRHAAERHRQPGRAARRRQRRGARQRRDLPGRLARAAGRRARRQRRDRQAAAASPRSPAAAWPISSASSRRSRRR